MDQTTDAPERWLPVPGYGGSYEVSDLGRVHSLHRKGRILSPRSNHKGYLEVGLWANNQRVTRGIHKLVLAAFVGPYPSQETVIRHLDGDPSNNKLRNLAYGTGTENQLDRVRHGTHNNSSKSHCPHGHPYDEENTYRIPSRPRTRYCRACLRASNASRSKPAT